MRSKLLIYALISFNFKTCPTRQILLKNLVNTKFFNPEFLNANFFETDLGLFSQDQLFSTLIAEILV